MVETLLILVIILFIMVIGIILFLWWQFINTDSMLYRLVKNRIRLSSLDDKELEEEDE